MKSTPETPYILNNINSWIHCIELSVSPRENHSNEFIAPPDHHFHDYIELLYSLNTNASVWINGIPHSFRDGDLAVINSREPHVVTFHSDCEYICIKFLPQILYADEQALFEFKYVLPFLNHDSHQKIFHQEEILETDIRRLILEIMSEWNEKGTAYELMIRSAIIKIIATIFRHWNLPEDTRQEQFLTAPMKKALSYISDNYNTINEKDVAEHCGLSYSHFSYAFKQLMGRSFNEYLTSIKIKEAEKLLLTGDLSVTDIAYETGFSTVSHFISRFREHKGLTPKNFRQNVRNGISSLP